MTHNRRRTRSLPLLAASLLAAAALLPTPTHAKAPEPSPYPITWELKFTPGKLKRIVVNVPGQSAPQAYWYLPYQIQNDTQQVQTFLPYFEIMLEDGRMIRSDKNIPPVVFQEIKKREGNKFLQPSIQVAGTIRVGEDEAKDSVAIWPEPALRMGAFSVYVQGLSGEATTVPSPDPKKKEPVILRKTLQLNYIIRGDEFYPGEDEVNESPQRWVMR